MGGPGTATEVLNLYIYNLALKRFSFDKAFAASTAFVALALLFMFVYVRFSVAQER